MGDIFYATNHTSLAYNALSEQYTNGVEVVTRHKILDRVRVCDIIYMYREDFEYNKDLYYFEPLDVMMPTKERAIIDTIIYGGISEHEIYFAINEYIDIYGTREQLVNKGIEYGVTVAEMNKWVDESLKFMDGYWDY